MPFSPTGVYTLPNGTLATSGQTILVSQHNPFAQDVESALSSTLLRTGVAPMLANLNMNSFKITGLADGTAATDAATVSQVSAVQAAGLIYGLRCSNNAADPTNDIDVQTGVCASVLSGFNLMTLGAITKKLDVNWVVGNNQGMLDTGVVANTTYHLYVIKRVDTGVTDLLASQSATAPTLPANYTQYRRIWSIIREAGAIREFKQYGDVCKCAPVVAISGTTAYGTQLTNMKVPGGIAAQPIFRTRGVTDASSGIVVSAGDADAGAVQAVVGTCGLNSIADVFTNGGFWANTAGQIVTSMSGSPTSFSITALGWIDNRGRYGLNG